MLPTWVKFPISNTPATFFFPTAPPYFRLVILEGGGFALGFGKGGHRKRLISYSPTLIFSLLHKLVAFLLDLDLDQTKERQNRI